MDAAGNRTMAPSEIDTRMIRTILYGKEHPLNVYFLDEDIFPDGPPSLRYMNFSYAKFNGIDFTGLDLTGTEFYAAELNDANFLNAVLKDTSFQWCELNNVNFEGATFEGDYAAGGLFDGATITSCNFSGTSIVDSPFAQGQLRGYQPKPYAGEKKPIQPNFASININDEGVNVANQRKMKISTFLAHNRTGLVFRVIQGSQKVDYLLTKNHIRKEMKNNNLTIYPCFKPTNTPGGNYDNSRPIINIGNMIAPRVFVLKKVFNKLLRSSKRGFVFFTDAESEKVPTFVSTQILENRTGYMSALHCNKQGGREILWYAQHLPLAELGEEPLAELGEEPLAELGDEFNPADFPEEEEEINYPPPPTDYIDPYGSSSEGDSEPAAPPAENANYNPPAEEDFSDAYAELPALNLNTDTGIAVRNNQGTITVFANAPPLPLRDPLNSTMFTTTFVLQVKDSENTKNYLIKYNDLVNVFRRNQQDAYPCRTDRPTNAGEHIDKTRNLINIGKIIKKDIYVHKAQFKQCFISRNAIRAQRTFVVYNNPADEVIPAVTPNVSNVAQCKGPVSLWTIKKLPNIPIEGQPAEALQREAPPAEASAPPAPSSERLLSGWQVGDRIQYWFPALLNLPPAEGTVLASLQPGARYHFYENNEDYISVEDETIEITVGAKEGYIPISILGDKTPEAAQGPAPLRP